MNVLLRLLDPALRADVAAAVRALGHDAWEAPELPHPSAQLWESGADVVVVDLADRDALHWIRELRASAAGVSLLALGNDADPTVAIEALRAGANGFFRRPFDVTTLERALVSAARRHGRPSADAEFVAEDPRTRALLEETGRAAQSDATLLLHGASGTGKTRLARWIHRTSARAARPCVEVSCADLTGCDADAVLLGRGGDGRPAGRIEAAHGGTLVLEEIEELPLALQPAVLHALLEGRVRPLGTPRTVPIDVRVVATTRCNLSERVATGRFLEDLRVRLGVIEIEVPPLRDRPLDVQPIAETFLRGFAEAAQRPAALLDPAAVKSLVGHPLSGNLHELESLMRRAALVFPGEPIRLDELTGPLAPARNPAPISFSGFDLRSLERMVIARALEASAGNRTVAARALGISARTLRAKIRRYQLV